MNWAFPSHNLSEGDFRALEKCGIPRDVALGAKLARVDSDSGAAAVGQNGNRDYSGILFPYYWPSEDHYREVRLRRDNPEMEFRDGKQRPKDKYLGPPGRPPLIYFYPVTPPEWLFDPTLPIVILEGEKKTLAIYALGWHERDAAEKPRWLAAGLPGVWSWKGSTGKTGGSTGERLDEKGPIPDLDRILWRDRPAFILFDSNIHWNTKVQWAREKLAEELRRRGARVRFVDIPAEAGVNGIDDLVGVWGAERVLEYIEHTSYSSTERPKSYPVNGTSGRYSDTEGHAEDSEEEYRGVNWPEPLAPEAFFGIAGEVGRIIEPHSEADLAALLIQFLVAFGNLIGRSAHFKAGADKHFLNLFSVLVGPTSQGRKGSSLSAVQYFLESIDETWERERIFPGGLSTGEGLIWAVRDPVISPEPIKDRGRVVGYEDVVKDSGVADKRLLVTEPEFARVLQAAERKENTLSSVLRQSFDTGNLGILTKNQNARATNAHISLIGHITKDELQRLLTDTSKANGFCNRFMWVCSKRSKSLPEGGELHKVDLAPIRRRIASACEFSQKLGEMKRDGAAKKLWADIYTDLTNGKPGLLGAVTSRSEPITMRLACTYAVLDCSDLVLVPHLEAGYAVWKYCANSARFVFGDSLGDETADTILRALKAHPDGMSRKELFNDVFQKNKKSAEIGRALGILQQLGRARMDKVDSKGPRPREVWRAI